MAAIPSLDDAHQQGRVVVATIDAAESGQVLADRYTHVLSAMAAVSRCRSLLLGILDLDQAGRADLVGVLLRAELEVWYFGVIALLGDNADIERLTADHRYWKNELAKALPGVDLDVGVRAPFSVHQRARRADELLPQVGESSGNAIEWYRTVYAAESLTGAHAGFESLKPYVFEGRDEIIGIIHEPQIEERLRYGRLRIAAILAALLAKWTWERAGLDGSAFDGIAGLGDET